jgi:type I restriction enzyme S subunit
MKQGNALSLPKGWELKKMGEVLSIERGGSPRPIEKYMTNSPDGINWIKISDATASDKYIYETKEKIIKDGLHKTRFVNEGDFILSNSMSFGRPYIMKTTGCIHDGWLVLKQNGKKIFETEFLYYLLSSPFVFQQFNSKAAGSTVRNLNISLVSSVDVTIPPLPEQQRIVAILDDAFSKIEKAKVNAEQNLKNAKELFESLLFRIFDLGINEEKWELEKLEKFSKVVVGYVGPISKEYTADLKSVLLLSTKNITSKGVSLEKLTRINYAFHNKNRKSQLLPGDILVARHGNSGQAAVIPVSIEEAHALNVIIIKKSETISSEYICFLLNSGVLDKIAASKGGSVQEIINTSIIKDLVIPYPPIKTQKIVVQKLEALSKETKKLEAIYKQKIKDLEELKKSVLQKAFSGEL